MSVTFQAISPHYRFFLGIDPGLTGGVAVIDEDKTVILLEKTPVAWAGRGPTRKHIYCIDAMYAALDTIVKGCSPANLTVCIELQHAFPGQGVVSTGTTMYGYGIWIGLLHAVGLTYTEVKPRAWKTFYGLLKAEKVASVALAQLMFPGIRHLQASEHGLADALLLAGYGSKEYRNGRQTVGAVSGASAESSAGVGGSPGG